MLRSKLPLILGLLLLLPLAFPTLAFAQGQLPDPDTATGSIDAIVQVINHLGVWVLLVVLCVAWLYTALRDKQDIGAVFDQKLRELRESDTFTRLEQDFEALPDNVEATVGTVGEALGVVKRFLPADSSAFRLLDAVELTIKDLADGVEETPLKQG